MVHNDITGKRFGNLEVVQFLRKEPYTQKSQKGFRYIYLCLCDCGSLFDATSTSIIAEHKRSCGCMRIRSGDMNGNWTGHEDLKGGHWTSIQRHAKDKGRSFTITIHDAWDKFISQNRKCALTGVELNMTSPVRSLRNASLDRIDSSKGYDKGNVQWVHKDINQMKSAMSEEKFIAWCKAVATHR